MIIKTTCYRATLTHYRYCCSAKPNIMKYLNVAEKNDAAKNISAILSRGASNRREGLSKYNKIYEWNGQLNGQDTRMIMTSVSGHLLNYAFTTVVRNWMSCDPIDLFDAPVSKICPKDNENIKKTLEREVRYCQGLIIWTDCDREGENIGYEVVEVCKAIRGNIKVLRAVFSEITAASIHRALANLQQPNKNVSDAVDVRQEIDLRTGAAFTRLQTLRLQRVFPQNLANKLISYGSCQFPTLGFVVDRYKEIENFIAEQFWRINMSHRKADIITVFNWERERLFDEVSCGAIYDACLEAAITIVEGVDARPKSKWRPLPLDTIEMEKTISRKLRINAKEVMRVAERLYMKGLISYPRTETDIFPTELDLRGLVEQQRRDGRWGAFAARVLDEYGGPNPRQGKKSDHAHPPIHPTKAVTGGADGQLTGNDQRVYEFIVRRFLACVSKDAEGLETVVRVSLANEVFTAKGLHVIARHYLDVYVYDSWGDKQVGAYQLGEQFTPTLEMTGGATTPPNLLTEADLISLMERHGIGTDATQADHIETIKSREYVALRDGRHFVPGTLGMGLVEGYNEIGLQVSLAKPTLRADFERELRAICDGRAQAARVRTDQIAIYRRVFQTVAARMACLDASIAQRFRLNGANAGDGGGAPPPPPPPRPPAAPSNRRRDHHGGNDGYGGGAPPPPRPPAAPSNRHHDHHGGNDGYGGGAPPLPPPAPNNRRHDNHGDSNDFDDDNDDFHHNNTDDVRPHRHSRTNTRTKTNIVNNRTNNISKPSRREISSSAIDNSKELEREDRINDTSYWDNAPSTSRQLPPSPSPLVHKKRRSLLYINKIFNTYAHKMKFLPPLPSDISDTLSVASKDMPLIYFDHHGELLSFRMRTAYDEQVVCNCNATADLQCFTEQGANYGRMFYSCGRNNICNMFLWKDGDMDDDDDDDVESEKPTSSEDWAELPSSPSPSPSPLSPQPQPSQHPRCNCNQKAALRTVGKAGPNRGRPFYGCPKPMGQSCKFFHWADELGHEVASGRGGAGAFTRSSPRRGRGGRGGRGKGRGRKKAARPKASTVAAKTSGISKSTGGGRGRAKRK